MTKTETEIARKQRDGRLRDRHGQTDRQTDKQTDRQTERQ